MEREFQNKNIVFVWTLIKVIFTYMQCDAKVENKIKVEEEYRKWGKEIEEEYRTCRLLFHF